MSASSITFNIISKPPLKPFTKTFEEIREDLGRFQAAIWVNISIIELKKLFIIPYLRRKHDISVYPYDINVDNHSRFDLLRDVNNIHLNVEVTVLPSANDLKVAQLLSKDEYSTLNKYFSGLSVNDIKNKSERDFIQIANDIDKPIAQLFYRDLIE